MTVWAPGLWLAAPDELDLSASAHTTLLQPAGELSAPPYGSWADWKSGEGGEKKKKDAAGRKKSVSEMLPVLDAEEARVDRFI